jgi:mRNA interferase MazF
LTRVIVVPLTSNTERLFPGEARVNVAGTDSKAMADQLMTADKTRLKSKLGELSKPDMQAVEAAIRLQLGLAK